MWQKITFETASTPAAHIRTKLFLSSHQKPFCILQSLCMKSLNKLEAVQPKNCDPSFNNNDQVAPKLPQSYLQAN